MSTTLSARARYGATRQRLQGLVAGLRAIGQGAAVEAATAKVVKLFEGIVRSKLPKHEDTGLALTTARVKVDGSGVALSQQRYLRYQRRWWPFARGVPPFLLQRALKIFAAETRALLTQGRAPAGVVELLGDDLKDDPPKKARKRKTT